MPRLKMYGALPPYISMARHRNVFTFIEQVKRKG
jgi:hypothetical protein